ncbi:MAG TPA: DeoR/GlpR family DNA-binding transcription regulator [Chitinophagaceae bacterium]|jgi:DeoR family transcriptional regulator of aga operon|nr:DeoR/GlpR family DNA-binding transcription regulator [Chitinophagaceae bacterium]
MLSIAKRHEAILDKLQLEGYVNVLDLCKGLDVSAVTIRKDLKLLEDKGLLFRSHGGASLHNPYINERPVNEKEHVRADEKNRIGIAAAGTIIHDDAIIIASGTTVMALARHIKPLGHLTAITASLSVALELNRHPEIEVMQLGGTLRKSSSSVAGLFGESMLEHFSCSKLFLGIDGIDLEFGLTTTNMMEAHLNQKMMQAAQKTIVLADSSKFGRRGFGKIGTLEELDQIITDKDAPSHFIKALEEKGIEVILV